MQKRNYKTTYQAHFLACIFGIRGLLGYII